MHESESLQKQCSQNVNAKMIPVETIPGKGEGNKGEKWRE
jgi:hypothetical protein